MGIAELVLLTLVAAGAGVIGSMLGLGGGIFLVPIFTIFFGIDQKAAIGASAVAVVANSVVGSTVHLRSRFTNLRLAMLLQVTTAIGATVGAIVGVALNARIVSVIFAAVLLYAIYSMLAQRRARPTAAPGPVAPPVPMPGEPDHASPPATAAAMNPLSASYVDRGAPVSYTPARVRTGIGLGGLAGVLSGILGIGGGLVQVPAMSVLMRVPVKAAAGTSTFMVGFAAVATSAVYYASDEIDPQVVVASLLGVFVGSQIGPRITRRVSTERLVLFFVAIMAFLAASMILQAAAIDVPWAR